MGTVVRLFLFLAAMLLLWSATPPLPVTAQCVDGDASAECSQGDATGPGDDRVTVSSGEVVSEDVRGDAGNDTLVVEPAARVEANVQGDSPGSGDDSLLNQGSVDGTMSGDGGNDHLTNQGQIGGNMTAGDGDDTLVNAGTVGGDLDGGAGDDLIDNRRDASADDVFGRDGNDTLTVAGEVDDIHGEAGADVILVANGSADFVYAGPDDDEVTVVNGVVHDVIFGNGGDDTVTTVEAIVDTIDGGSGNDSVLNVGETALIYGQDGDDTLDNRGTAGDLYGGSGHDSIVNTGRSVFGTPANAEYVYAGGGNDTIVNDSVVIEVIFAQDGDDLIVNTGTVGSDINAGTGNDSIDHSGTTHNLYAEGGDDTLAITGTVTSDVFAGADDDTVTLEDGAVVDGMIDGGTGSDRLAFGFTTDDEDAYNAFAAQLAAASPGGGSVMWGGSSYRWRNFEQLANLLQLIRREAEAESNDAMQSVRIVLDTQRLNAVDAPVAVYCTGHGIELWTIGANGQGTHALTATLADLQTAPLAGGGSGLALTDGGQVAVSGPGGYHFQFDAGACGG